jgi:hypothetical protein
VQGPIGNTGPAGSVGPAGATGATGAQGLISNGFISGSTGPFSPVVGTWGFIGATGLVALNGSQRIIAFGSVPLGTNLAGGPWQFHIDLAYRLNGSMVAPTNFSGGGYMIAEISAGNNRPIWSVNGRSGTLPAGTYQIGIAVRGAVPGLNLDDNDFFNVTWMVVNN